jgi:PAS domain S-box-containing protein
MSSDLLISLSPFLLSGALTLMMGVFCLGRKDVPGARAYGINALAKTLMIAGFVMETASRDLATKIAWDNLQYIPMFIAPVALLVFAHQFTGRPFRLPLWKGLALGAFPVVFLALVFSDPVSAWIATGHHLEYGAHYSVLTYSFGPLLEAAAGYMYVLLALAFLVLIAEFKRVPRHYRTQIKVVMLGMLLPVLGGVLTVFDVSPLVHRDLTPVTFGLASGVVAWGLFRHNLFRRSLIEFEQIWHDLTEGIIVTDRDGVIVAVNPAAVALLDEAYGLVPGEKLQNALQRGYPQLYAAFASHLTTGEPVFNEFQASPRFLQIGVRSLTGFSGVPLGAVLQVHDDTREKALQEWLRAEASSSESTARRAEEQLHENEEQLEMALAGAELGTWDWKVPTGEVTFNSRWVEMLGLEKHEIEPRIESWERLIHPDDLSRARELLQEHLDGRTPMYEAEHRWRHKSGSWVWVLSRGKVISRDSEGRPLRASGTHLDVTERREAQTLQKELGDKLQRAERMESLGLLAGGVAHDLNNLLAPVVGYSQILLKQLEDRPDFAKRVQRIERAGKDAAELVQDLLALARRGRYEMKPLDLNLLVTLPTPARGDRGEIALPRTGRDFRLGSAPEEGHTQSARECLRCHERM